MVALRVLAAVRQAKRQWLHPLALLFEHAHPALRLIFTDDGLIICMCDVKSSLINQVKLTSTVGFDDTGKRHCEAYGFPDIHYKMPTRDTCGDRSPICFCSFRSIFVIWICKGRLIKRLIADNFEWRTVLHSVYELEIQSDLTHVVRLHRVPVR